MKETRWVELAPAHLFAFLRTNKELKAEQGAGSGEQGKDEEDNEN